MLDDTQEIHLLRIANQIVKDNGIPKGLDLVQQGQTLLYMMQSRSKRNIAQAELNFIDKSSSISDFDGFFKDTQAKQLFDIILKHLAYCIKRKACSQKDAEYLLCQSVINFKTTEFEKEFIKGFFTSRIKQELGIADPPRNSDLSSS